MDEESELDKWARVSDDASKLSEFLEWLEHKGIYLASYPEGEMSVLLPRHENFLELVSRYLGIDEKKLDAERKELLKSIKVE